MNNKDNIIVHTVEVLGIALLVCLVAILLIRSGEAEYTYTPQDTYSECVEVGGEVYCNSAYWEGTR